MRIYMAGAITGNLSPFWRNVWKVIQKGGIPDLQHELRRFINEGILSEDRAIDIPHFNIKEGYP